MLLTNRRHRMLFAALAAMEVAWFLPFALTLLIHWQRGSAQLGVRLLYGADQAPYLLFLVCWSLLLLYLAGADLLNRRQIDFPQRELLMIGVMIGAFLVAVRLLVFPTLSLTDWRWLSTTVGLIFNGSAQAAPVLFILTVNFFLWLRVALSSDRSLTFFAVGVSFRLGMLLALVGNSLYILVARQPVAAALVYLWLFFGFGLLAVALARVDEKAINASQSSGNALPWSRLVQLIAITGGAVALAMGSALLYTPTAIRMVLGWFSPLWQLLGALFLRLFFAIFWLVTPLLEWFAELMRALLARLEPNEIPPQEFGVGELDPSMVTMDELLRNATLMRYLLIALGLFVALVVIALIFVRPRPRIVPEEAEASSATGFSGVGNPFRRLRDLATLLRRYGLRPGLLAAISVQNLYANVCRLAGRRGYARPPAQPPDEYLPHLQAAFPGQESALTRLTAAYMRVHYGDQPAAGEELAQLRADYATIVALPATPQSAQIT